jgi:transposase
MYPKLVTVMSGRKNPRPVVYLRLVERVKDNGRWKDRVVANLGRQDIVGREVLGDLLKKLRRFTDEVLVTPGEIESREAKDYGNVLVIDKLWAEIGLEGWISECCGRIPPVSLGEPGIRAMVTNRLTAPKSKLGLYEWIDTVHVPGWPPRAQNSLKKIVLPKDPIDFVEWFYRTMDWLVKGRNKERIEERLGEWAKSLFPVDVVFYDITNIQFEGWEELKQARHGYIRLGRKNHKQILLGLVMVEGLPVAGHIFRGNRAEKTTLLWVKKKLKKQFNVGRVVFVCDRGMVTEKSLGEIESEKDGYIVALKRRRCEEVAPLLQEGLERFTLLETPIGRARLFAWEAPPQDGKRRIVVYNPAKAQEEKTKRAAVRRELEEGLGELRRKVRAGEQKSVKTIVTQAEKILSRKHGKRYFVYDAKGEGQFEFRPNEKNLALEESLDGKFVIKTTEGQLSLKEAVFKYKDLMKIEDGFRDLKDFIRVAPVFHWRYRRVKAHVFICVLALLLERYMEKKLHQAGLALSARKALEKLKNIKVVTNRVGTLILKYVTPPTQELDRILAACGIFELPKILPDLERQAPEGQRKTPPKEKG